MQLSNYKLGTKLGAAFVLIVSLTAAVGALSFAQLGVVNASSEAMATDSLPSIKAAGEITRTLAGLRQAEADQFLTADAQHVAANDQRMVELKAALARQQSAYAPLVSSDSERQAYSKFTGDAAAFLALHEKLVGLTRGGTKTQAEAQAMYRNESKVAHQAMADDLQLLTDINDKSASAAYATAQATFTHTRAWVVGLVLASIGIGAVLALGMLRLVARPVKAAALAAERFAEGDLTLELDTSGKDETAQLLQALARMQAQLAQTVGSVRANADSVATASAQIAQGNQDLSQRTEQQASALQQTAASMEELSATVKQNADNARQANQLAQSASGVAVRGGDVVGQVVDTMKGINDSSRKIADIISVIDGIAFQTNILALNAAVEAARAGEQGRGFAVVATEVRSLAQRSAGAAKEIKSLISASVERVERGSALVDQAGVTMTEVVASIRRVTDIMGEISAASIEQSAGVAQVGEAIGQMDQATQQNAALVEESAAAAESLKTQAQALVAAVAVFKLDAFSPMMHAMPVETRPTARPGVERRGPRRASNVTRPAFGSKMAAATAAAPASVVAAHGGAVADRTGTDDWESF